MRVLHTSDWHIGCTLYGRKRYGEHEAFFNWLIATLNEQRVDVLLVAGDIFDTTMPSHRAQELYYLFLRQVAATPCRHVVITGGNHDSPSFLNAPKELLKAFSVHVLGSMPATLAEEVLLLHDEAGQPELIVCAAPYLRDRDVRVVEPGEGIAEKDGNLIDGIGKHYQALTAFAEQIRAGLGVDIPIIAMGHLFTAGGQTIDGDGVREMYVGSLAHIDATMFPAGLDYVALGHLHVPQKVRGREDIRYSGSPLPMGFNEANQQKSLSLVEFQGREAELTLIAIPVFQVLAQIKGNWLHIAEKIEALAQTGSYAWLEIIYTGQEILGDLRERVETAVAPTNMEIVRIKNERLAGAILEQIGEKETLANLNADDVFKRCLTAHKVPEAQWPVLEKTYQEALSSLLEEDKQAE